ncbi:hypothetical protein FROZEN_98 [Erwinia phage vB_EamP_Frozen]|uniref:Uncharacterized protein n=2 Tax=Johnsonvirus frozen TaxID=1982578 RepID=A0A191ZDC9_9CAUD|nr:hypothetical protein FROZEN_98 [Erwinia phage vB_EamP_Frozen]ANJ65219.1 hypothetical protein FROZEN_98 [Erwinia phage vB_EamP_Frozen]ANJ65394.1 hypothetical protein GUTMEISTER_90 [Erwinia phage vB_EamP_Gutmeister]
MLSKDVVVRALPANLKGAVTDQMVDLLNNITTDQIIAEQVRDNFVAYSGVMKDGKFKIEDYIRAVTYVSYKLMGDSNQDAYFKTFPDRYQNMLVKGTSDKDMRAYVSMYAKGKLVNLIMEQSLVPTWVLNQDIHQKAINTQALIMNDPNVCSRDRVAAANSILTHLGRPKEVGPLLNIDMRPQSGINELQDLLGKMAVQQRDLIGSGVSIKEIAATKIIEGEAVHDDNS